MPVFHFTCLVEGVDVLDDQSSYRVDEHSASFLEDAPLEWATFIRDGARHKVVFSYPAASYESAVAAATAALHEALPGIEVTSVVEGREPGMFDIS